MYTLLCNNVDGYPHTSGKWKNKPTREQLIKEFSDLYENAKSEILADKILAWGSAEARDSACNTYELKKL